MNLYRFLYCLTLSAPSGFLAKKKKRFLGKVIATLFFVAREKKFKLYFLAN